MPLALQGTYLGLGSIVRLDNEDVSGLFVVLARGAYRPDSETSTVLPRYLVGPHPYGESPDRETFPILAGEVREVVFEGYTDDADAAFLEDLLEQMEHGRRPTTPAEQFTDSLTVVPETEAEAEGPPHGADPFEGLRKLIGGNHGKDER
ncbi:MAG: DUF4176 domain-containing protein [Leifsonia sp.]